MSEPQVGGYRILGELRKESLGVCYRAHDTVRDQDVTLKVLSPDYVNDPESQARFAREAKLLARLTHPNIVTIHDLGNEGGVLYMVLEPLNGITLQQALESRVGLDQGLEGGITLKVGLGVLMKVLRGLEHVHQAGVVHRNISPVSILMQPDGTVKITDFGVARVTTASMSGTANIEGTVDYLSPPQVKGPTVDSRSDLFSVGCVLYEMLTGQRPFHGENLMTIFYKITHEEPDFDQIPAGPAHDALRAIVKKSLAKGVEDRYQDASSMALDLQEVRATR